MLVAMVVQLAFHGSILDRSIVDRSLSNDDGGAHCKLEVVPWMLFFGPPVMK